MAEFLDGVPRHPKMHPCGLVLSRQPMHELTPTFIANKGYPTTHFDMDAVEAVGLVKMDILAQGGLAAMRDVKQTLSARGIHIDLENLEPWKDPRVWELIASGGARAVHHIESPAMISLCRMCNVREIDGLVAIVSVIRPGAANEGKKQAFTRRYQGLEPVAYPHPSLGSCLRSTYGLVVYEEHILQISEAFAGLNPGRADVLRRALNKQNFPMIEKIRGEFFESAQSRGHSPEKIAEVWGLVTGFAGYAFCKAHSTAYGVEAYQAAWLKNYYPVEFMAAVLSNGKGFYHPIVYVLECHRLGVTLLPPSVNQPGPLFTPEGRTIRVPIRCIKGLSERTNERILAGRQREPFPTLAGFYRRVAPLPEEMEAMLRVGAFDEFGKSRTAQFWECQFLHRAFGTPDAGRQGLLLPEAPLQSPPRREPLESAIPPIPPIPLQEPTRRERLESENELLGFPVSGHPLELHDHIAWETYCPVSRLAEHVGEEVVTCGLVVEQRTHHQITGEPMKFLTLADWTGMVETELFAQTYKSYGLATVRYPVLEITARVEPYENARGFSLRVLHAGKPRTIASREMREKAV
jgi:error-prone DNA polymerase